MGVAISRGGVAISRGGVAISRGGVAISRGGVAISRGAPRCSLHLDALYTVAQFTLPPAVMLLTPKYLPRLAAVVALFTRFGLRDLAKQQGLITLVPSEGDVPPGDIAEQREHAEGFRKRLIELGPAYVKLGQLLSTRPDRLPDPYIQPRYRRARCCSR